MEMTVNNSNTSNRILGGLFKDHDSAARAYQALLDQGYHKDDITVIMSDEIREKYFPDMENVHTTVEHKTLEGTGVGSIIGGTLGALTAAVLAVGTSLVIPALGITVAGPLAASLAGGGAGSFTGGMIGALIGANIPEEKAKLYETGIKSGGILIQVTPSSEIAYQNLENEWKLQAGSII